MYERNCEVEHEEDIARLLRGVWEQDGKEIPVTSYSQELSTDTWEKCENICLREKVMCWNWDPGRI